MMRLLLLLLAATLLASCTTRQASPSLVAIPVPFGGGELKEDVWLAAEKGLDEPVEESSEKERGFFWLLPFNLEQRAIELFLDREGEKRAGTAVSTNARYNDLLGPLFLTTLPLRLWRSEYHYRRGTESPVSRRGFYWTPLWAWSWEKGEPINDGVRYKMRGVPLLYAKARIEFEGDNEESSRVTLHQTLWTLGPALANFSVVDGDGDRFEGWAGTPAFLGGALGTLLWSGYSLTGDGSREGGRSTVTGHGPFFGLLGFFQARSNYLVGEHGKSRLEALPQETTRLLLAGILWMDSVERRADGRKWNAKHGPLWGMFGWGREDGFFTLRLLWVPIRF